MRTNPLPAETEDLLAELATIGSYTIGGQTSYNWPRIEEKLGFRLPTQYKAYAESFPPGAFYYLHVFHPAASESPPWPKPWGLVEEVTELSSALKPLDDSKPARYLTYPEPGGLIAWACCDGDFYLAWLPDSDDPDQWPVIAYEMGADDGEPVEGSTLQALIRVLRGDAGRTVFPDWFYDEPRTFVVGDPANG